MKASKPFTLSGRVLESLLESRITRSGLAKRLRVSCSYLSKIKSGEYEFSDVDLDRIERLTRKPLWLLLLGPEPAPTASAEVRQVYREALQLLNESEAVRKELSLRLEE